MKNNNKSAIFPKLPTKMKDKLLLINLPSWGSWRRKSGKIIPNDPFSRFVPRNIIPAEKVNNPLALKHSLIEIWRKKRQTEKTWILINCRALRYIWLNNFSLPLKLDLHSPTAQNNHEFSIVMTISSKNHHQPNVFTRLGSVKDLNYAADALRLNFRQPLRREIIFNVMN